MRRAHDRLDWRLAFREIKKGRGRYLLAALVIGLVVAMAVAAATINRSSQATPARLVQWLIGNQADAMVQWYEDKPLHQSPDGQTVDSGTDTPASDVDARFDKVFFGRPSVKLSTTDVVMRSASAVTNFEPALQGDLADPLLAGVYDIWRGTVPSSPGEVTLSREDAKTLGVGVGDTIEIKLAYGTSDFVTVKVVGIHQDNAYGYQVGLSEGSLSDNQEYTPSPVWFVGGGPVSWGDVMASNGFGLVTTSRSVVLDPPPDYQVPLYQTPGWQPFDQTPFLLIMVLAYLAIGGTLVVLLIAPVFTIGARRSRRDYALLRAQGATTGDIRAIMLRSCGLVGAAASAIGAGLGVAIAAVLIAISHASDPHFLPDLRVGLLDLVGIVAAGTLISVIAAWFPARSATREDVVLALRDQDTDLHKVTRTRPLLVVIGAAATVATGAFALLRHDPPWLILTGVLGVLTLVLGVRQSLSWLARLAPRLPLSARVSLRDAARRADRTAPAATVVMAAIATACCASIMMASGVATDAASFALPAKPGTLMISDGDYLAPVGDDFMPPPATTSRPEQWQQLRQILDQAVPVSQMVDVNMLFTSDDASLSMVIDPSLVCPAWSDQTRKVNRQKGLPANQGYPAKANSPNCVSYKPTNAPVYWTSDGQSIVVDDGTLVRALGLPGADKAAEALAAGKIVVTRSLDMWGDGTAHIGVMVDDPVAAPQWEAEVEAASQSGSTDYLPPPPYIARATVVASAVLVDMPSAVWEAFIPPSLVTAPPLNQQNPIVRRVGVIAVTDQVLGSRAFDELKSQLASVNVSSIYQVVPYDDGGQGQVTTGVITAAALFAFIVTWGASRLAIADLRPDMRVIYEVGATGRVRRRVAALTTLTIGLLGSVIGLAAGLLLGLSLLAVQAYNQVSAAQQVIAIPWLPITVMAVVIPVLTAGLAWLLERRTPVDPGR